MSRIWGSGGPPEGVPPYRGVPPRSRGPGGPPEGGPPGTPKNCIFVRYLITLPVGTKWDTIPGRLPGHNPAPLAPLPWDRSRYPPSRGYHTGAQRHRIGHGVAMGTSPSRRSRCGAASAPGASASDAGPPQTDVPWRRISGPSCSEVRHPVSAIDAPQPTGRRQGERRSHGRRVDIFRRGRVDALAATMGGSALAAPPSSVTE